MVPNAFWKQAAAKASSPLSLHEYAIKKIAEGTTGYHALQWHQMADGEMILSYSSAHKLYQRQRMTIAKKQGHWRNLVSDTALFGLVFGLTNVISYLFVVVTGRMLLPAEFGVFNALLGLLTMAGAIAGAVQAAVTRAVSQHADRATFAALMRTTWRVAMPVTGMLTVVAIPFASTIGANATQVILCGAVLLAMIVGVAAIGFLVGLGKVRAQADLAFLGAIARLVAGWALMVAGFGASGALAGYAFNYALIFVLAYAMSRRASRRLARPTVGLAPVLRIEVSAVATFVLAFAPYSLDQSMVQFFNPALGGAYAAVATIAKLAFFVAYPITAVAYPNLLTQKTHSKRIKMLAMASTAALFITSMLTLVIGAYSHEVARIFFGNRFSESAQFLWPLALGVACFSLSILGVHAQIAWGGRAGYVPSAITVAASAILFAFRHDTLGVVVENQVWVFALQMVLVWSLLALTIARSRSSKNAAPTNSPAGP